MALEPVVEQGSVGAAFEQDRSEQPFALFGRDQAGARTPFATAFTVYLLPPKTPTMRSVSCALKSTLIQIQGCPSRCSRDFRATYTVDNTAVEVVM